MAVEAIVVPIVGLLFQAPLLRQAPRCCSALLATGTLGFAAVGTLFAAMLVRARSRDVLLPVLLYPIAVPVIIAGVQGTAASLQPEADAAGARMAGDADILRCSFRHAGALDLRTGHERMTQPHEARSLDPTVSRVPAGMFAAAPFMIVGAPLRVDDGARPEDFLFPRARRR